MNAYKRTERRQWISKLITYGGFTLTEIKKAVRFYELRDYEIRTNRYGWD